MAKKTLNIVTNGNRGGLPVANQGMKLSKIIALDKIEEHEQFKELYSIDEDLLERIAEDMKSNKFDASQPVHIWLTKDEDETEHFYLIDGYTRIKAAKLAGLETVPYFEHTFESFEEAHRYALHLQVDRRNLNGMDLLHNIEALMGSEYIQNMKGNKNAAMGEMLGVSEKTIERAKFVENNATEEQIEAIESGEATINSTYDELKGKKKKADRQVSVDDEADDISDALDDTSGDPKGIVIGNHSDGIERPNNRLSDKEDNERTRERKIAHELGFTEGFLQAANHILMQILHGVDTSALYIGLFCNKHNMEYDYLRNCIGNDPAQCYEYNDFRKKLFEERPKLKDLNPMPLEDFKTEEHDEDEDAQYLDFGKENEDSENTSEYEETENESSIETETDSDNEAFDLGFGED